MQPALRFLLLASSLAALPLAGFGAEGGAVNALTPAEVASGKILLFDGSSTFGWAPRGNARWVVHGDSLSPIAGSGVGMLCTTSEFADFELEADVWIDGTANSGIFLRCPTTGDIDGFNAYEVNVYDPHPDWPTGSINEVGRTRERVQTVGKWNRFVIRASGPDLQVTINEQTTLRVADGRSRRGCIGLQYNGTGEVFFRNLRLRPLGLRSIFNGKDLSGWKPIPGRKSVYSVTPEGWLNVKDGNGDLQSEGEYGDFVFQLDIISNGTHLNSGVFFRAIPGSFWSGYESQIRNQWLGTDRSRPVDFGTGGIYNRQPARRVVSSDRQWFTKTIVAAGLHLAVWIDGYQVSDYQDTRPPAESARQGARTKAGVLSLQGHDPTTDLSFRRLRIREYPPVRK